MHERHARDSPDLRPNLSSLTPDPDEDDSDLDNIGNSSHVAAYQPYKTKRIGLIGGKKAEPKSKAISENAREPSSSPQHASTPEPSLETPPITPKKRAGSSKLGVIGGRKVATQSQHQGLVQTSEDSQADPSKNNSAGTVSSVRAVNDSTSELRGRLKTEEVKREESPIQKETSQDRANRRREDLKRQLAISAGGTQKRKRRF